MNRGLMEGWGAANSMMVMGEGRNSDPLQLMLLKLFIKTLAVGNASRLQGVEIGTEVTMGR